MDGVAARRVHWQLFGEVSAFAPEPGPPLGSRSRAVLAMLLLAGRTTVTAESLAEGLWADKRPKTATNSLHRFISDIRSLLGSEAERLATNSDGYKLTVFDGELDLDLARDALIQGRSLLTERQPAEALDALEEGLHHARGVPLGGVGSAAMYTAAVVALQDLVATLTTSRFEAALALGHHAALGDQISEFAAKNPHSEQAWALHMLSLYRSGRQQQALDAGETLRKHLLEELGVTPSPPIAKLTHQILNHADELQLTDRPAAVQSQATTRPARSREFPIQLQRSLQTPMVGRAGPMMRAEQALTGLGADFPQVTFVAGVPGIGKTRLAAELAARVVDIGGTVLYGRSDEDTSLPLGAWAEALTQVTTSHGGALAQALPAAARDALSTILPDLNQSATPSSVTGFAVQVAAELRRAVLFQAVVQLLDAAAETNPVAVVLDDLQWADTATVRLVRHVARHVSRAVWIIGVYRDNELDAQPLLQEVVTTLLPEPHVHQEQLDGIADIAIGELVQSLLPEVNEARLPDFAHALQLETNGNPFFATEIVRNMIEADPGQLTLSLGTSDAATIELPDSVRHVIRQRVLRLGTGPSRTLHHAAIFGREFNLAELAVILDNDNDDDRDGISNFLEAAMRAGLMADVTDQVDRFAFAHDLIHHSLYQEVGLLERRRLHGAAADAIAACTPTGLESNDRALEIAGHLLEAQDPQRAQQTVDAIDLAADVANARHAPAEAAALHARGIELVASAAFGTELVEPDQIRLRMVIQRGIELRNAGDPGYRQALLDAGEQARQLGDSEAQVQAALANTRGVQTHVWEVDSERVEQLRHAVAALGDEQSSRRADLLASFASELWGDNDRAESARLRAESITLARRLGDHATLANTLARAARARNANTPIDEVRSLADELYSMVDNADQFDPYLSIKLLRAVQNQALRDADADRLHAMSAAIKTLTVATQLPVCHRSDVLSDVLIAGLRGEGERYLQLAEEALALSIDMGDPESFIAYEGHYLVGMDMLGRAKEVLPLIAQVAADRPADVYQAITAAGHAKCGDIQSAHVVLQAGLQRGFAAAVDDYTIQGLQLWSDAAGLTDHLEACQVLYPMLSPHSGRLAGHVVLVTQPVDISLGRLARVLGDYPQSLAHFDISDRICAEFDASWMQGMTDVSRARTLLEIDETAQAQSYLEQAIIRAETDHHPGIAADATSLLNQIGRSDS